MSRFRKLSHAIWHCQYHVIWVPKYRYRVLFGDVGEEVKNCIRTFCGQLKCEIKELSVQLDPVHAVVLVPPKVSISDFMGTGPCVRAQPLHSDPPPRYNLRMRITRLQRYRIRHG